MYFLSAHSSLRHCNRLESVWFNGYLPVTSGPENQPPFHIFVLSVTLSLLQIKQT
jgi:hypothetical protein